MSPEMVEAKRRNGLHQNCWVAWCKVCGQRLTNCDFTEHGAIQIALESEHECEMDKHV